MTPETCFLVETDGSFFATLQNMGGDGHPWILRYEFEGSLSPSAGKFNLRSSTIFGFQFKRNHIDY